MCLDSVMKIVYCILGKGRDSDARTTVYKKNEDMVYQLKMKASRAFFSDADKRFGTMPFTLRAFEEETKSKMGVVECERHGLMKPYNVSHWIGCSQSSHAVQPIS